MRREFSVAVCTTHNWDCLLVPFSLFQLWIICFYPNNNRQYFGSLFKLHIFFLFFTPLALTRAERTDVGIGAPAISISRDNGTAGAHYLIDSNSLPTYYIVTFLLRRTRHPPHTPPTPCLDGCFIMFKRTIYCSRVDPRSHLLDRLRRR